MPVPSGVAPGPIQEVVRRIHSLPTLPQMAVDVAMLARKEDVTMSMVAGKIDRDPAISSKLLRVANSSYYGLPRSVRTTESAILVLGLKQVANVVLGITVVRAFPPPPGLPSFDREKFWTHSAAVGLTARILSDHLGLPVNGEEFSAGVLHDVGKIVLDQYFHEDFLRGLDASRQKGISEAEAEREIFGVTHAELGGWMLDQWKLPHSLAHAAAFHHAPESCPEDRALVSIIALSDELTRLAGLSLESETSVPIGEHPGWAILAQEGGMEIPDPDAAAATVLERLDAARSRGELGWLKG